MTSTRQRVACPECRGDTSSSTGFRPSTPASDPRPSAKSSTEGERTIHSASPGGGAIGEAGVGVVHAVVTLRRRRAVDAGVGLDELPIAVGFGSLQEVRPSRLHAVPARPLDLPAPSAPVLLRPGVPAAPGVRERPWSYQPGSAPPEAVAGLVAAPDRPAVRVVEPAPLRLTARGRAVLLIVAAAIGLAVVLSAWFGAGATAAPTPAAPPAQVVVHSGDTLWTIAGRIAPNRDPRAVVDQLLRINRLDTPALVPGQVLRTH